MGHYAIWVEYGRGRKCTKQVLLGAWECRHNICTSENLGGGGRHGVCSFDILISEVPSTFNMKSEATNQTLMLEAGTRRLLLVSASTL